MVGQPLVVAVVVVVQRHPQQLEAPLAPADPHYMPTKRY